MTFTFPQKDIGCYNTDFFFVVDKIGYINVHQIDKIVQFNIVLRVKIHDH